MALVAGLTSGLRSGLSPALSVGRGTITPALLADNVNNADLSSYAFAETLTPPANTLLLLAVVCTHSTTAEVPNSVTGFGLTWTQAPGSASGTGTFASGARRVTWFYAWGASPSNGSVTIGFATGHLSCQYALISAPGAALAAPLQSTTNTVVGTTITGTLAALEYSENVHQYALGRVSAELSAPPATGGWAELSDRTHTLPNGAAETAWARGGLTADPTWTTSGGSCIVSLEIKAS